MFKYQNGLTAEALLLLLQVCDGNFPNGSFSHSFGLETLIEQEKLRNGDDFIYWLDQLMIRQLFPCEGLLTQLAWQAAIHEEIARVQELDRLAVVLCLAEHTRNGIIRIGRQTTAVMASLVDGAVIRAYQQYVADGHCYGVAAVALGVGFAESGVPCEMAVSASLFAAVSSLVAAGVRAIPLGQTEGQRIMRICRKRLAKLPDYHLRTIDDISSSAYEWELAQMNHKQMNGRLFMS